MPSKSRRGRRAGGALIAFLALALALAACGSNGGRGSSPSSSGSQSGSGSQTGSVSQTDPSEAAQVGEGEIENLSISVPLVPESMKTTATATQGDAVILLALEPLLGFEEGKTVPQLATSYKEVSQTHFTFQLRKGVKFWDGTPLTAADVVYSYEAQYGPETDSVFAQQWQDVKDVTAHGSTIDIELEKPNPQFIYTIQQTGIFSKKYAEAHGDKLGAPGVLNMGTGPYEFKAYTPGASIELVRNDHYWGNEPHIARITAQVMTSENQLLAAQSGELDAAFNIPVSQVPAIEAVPSFNVISGVEASIYKLDFDLPKGNWEDLHLRRAVAYCTDRQAIAEAVFPNNGGQIATSLVSQEQLESIMSKSEAEATQKQLAALMPEFNLEKAEEELAKSSQPNGFSTTLMVMASDPNLSSIGQIVAQECAKVGIKINVKEVDELTYYNGVYLEHEGEGLGIDNYSAGTPDPANIALEVLNSANAKPEGSGVNSADIVNAKIDALLKEYEEAPAGSPEQTKALVAFLEEAANELPYVPLIFPGAFLGLDEQYAYPSFNTFWWLERWYEDLGVAES